MEKLPAYRGISRDEFLAAVRLCPHHPAFAAGFEEWTRVTLKEVGRICNRRPIVSIKRR